MFGDKLFGSTDVCPAAWQHRCLAINCLAVQMFVQLPDSTDIWPKAVWQHRCLSSCLTAQMFGDKLFGSTDVCPAA